MNVESYTILHYGKSFLRHALMSVLDHVTRAHVVYCEHPSHGSRADVPCPETREELREAVAGLPKVVWHDVDFWHEGQHRDWALAQCKGDLALVVDADEVWDGDVLDACLRHAWDNSAQTWRLNFTHCWRSFSWVCTDGMWPDRIQDKRIGRDQRYGYLPKDLGTIYHFGYAVPSALQHYKWLLHGHISELRQDWWDKWDAWPPVDDVHPTCLNTWFPKPNDKDDWPAVLKDHPYAEMEPIP